MGVKLIFAFKFSLKTSKNRKYVDNIDGFSQTHLLITGGLVARNCEIFCLFLIKFGGTKIT